MFSVGSHQSTFLLDISQIPCSSTCFNNLKLSMYSCEQELRDKTLIAIRYGCEGFEFSWRPTTVLHSIYSMYHVMRAPSHACNSPYFVFIASSAFLMVSVSVDIFRRMESSAVFKGFESLQPSIKPLETRSVYFLQQPVLTVRRELTNGGTQSRSTRSGIVRGARASCLASVFSPPPRSIPAIWGGF